MSISNNKKGRGCGRGGGKIGPDRRPADDGKRLGLSESALDVASRVPEAEIPTNNNNKIIRIGEGV